MHSLLELVGYVSDDADEDEAADDMDEDGPLVLDDVAAPPEAGVVDGGDGVASLSTLFAL